MQLSDLIELLREHDMPTANAATAAQAILTALRAQADARPAGHFFKASRVHPWVQVEKECPNAVPLYTHPEASAPGLSDEDIFELWCSIPTQGGVDEDIVPFARALLTRASAATVGEPGADAGLDEAKAEAKELRHALSVARGQMRFMANWFKHSSPAEHRFADSAINSVNAVLERGKTK